MEETKMKLSCKALMWISAICWLIGGILLIWFAIPPNNPIILFAGLIFWLLATIYIGMYVICERFQRLLALLEK